MYKPRSCAFRDLFREFLLHCRVVKFIISIARKHSLFWINFDDAEPNVIREFICCEVKTLMYTLKKEELFNWKGWKFYSWKQLGKKSFKEPKKSRVVKKLLHLEIFPFSLKLFIHGLELCLYKILKGVFLRFVIIACFPLQPSRRCVNRATQHENVPLAYSLRRNKA